MRIPWYYFVFAFAGIGLALWYYFNRPAVNRHPIEKAREAKALKALAAETETETPGNEGTDQPAAGTN